MQKTLVDISHKSSSLSNGRYTKPTVMVSAQGSDQQFNTGLSRVAQPPMLDSQDMGKSMYVRKRSKVGTIISWGAWTTEYILGTIHTSSKIRASKESDESTACLDTDGYEHETAYSIYPAQWLVRFGIRSGLHLQIYSSSTQGWQTSLKPFCLVPDDSLIFEYCVNGNTSAVKGLFGKGLASVKDTNSSGWTPLHVSLPGARG